MLKALLDPVHHFLAFRQLVALLSRHRDLTWEMTKRELSERYAGQVIGILWVVGHPLLLMAIYVMVFGYIFQARIGNTEAMPRDYPTFLLSGMIAWLTFQDVMNKGTGVILSNAGLVKQIVFPIEVLPVTSVITSCITQFVATAVFIVYVLASHGSLSWTYLLLPILFIIQVLAMIGVCYILASIGVYFRDLREFVGVLNAAGLFLIPAIYIPGAVPQALEMFFYVNPFSYMVWCYQDAAYYGRFEHPWAWIVFPALSLGIFYTGYRIFRKLKSTFGNVL